MVIAAALWIVCCVPSASANAHDLYNQRIKVRRLLHTSVTVAGQPISYPKSGSAQVTMLYVEIPPGGQTGWHTHPVPGFAYVLSGRLTVQTKHASRVFSAGDAFAEVVNMLHNGKNLGLAPVKLIAVYTGVKNEAITKKN
jgi:quercetin dioxygenase-like cupin family protein